MNERTMKVLEFEKIVSKLSSLASSFLGKEIAEALIPETDIIKIKRLLKETDDGVSFVVRKGSPPLAGIHDIRSSLKRVQMGSILNPLELIRTADALRASRRLKSYGTDNVISDNENTVLSLINCLITNKKIEEKIGYSILSEDEIADAASSALGRIRKQIKDMQNSIKEKLNDIIKSSKYQKFMQESIVTIRGDRYVVPVKQEHRNDFPGLVHDSSSSGSTLFIEPISVVEANNNIKQLKIKEQLEIERILEELSGDVREIADSLESNISILARLDFIFAKAKLSLDYNCMSPKLNENKRIIIKKGRHPLLDKRSVVPIDFWIGDEFDTLVITGPNTGGKTVTLKTVGLLTLMTQAGLHIPANDGTEIGIFNKIFADIGDEQSIEQSLSTFSSHMRNIVKILEEADDNSLVLFDELGAGTDPTEGAALAMSILESLHQLGVIAIATTHYSELKIYAISTKGVENACCEFDVETLKPKYSLLIGVPGKSNAFAISKRLGLTDNIISRSREFLTQEDIKFEDMLMSIEKNRSDAEKEKIKAESYRIGIERIKNELEEQKRKIDIQRDKILGDAKEEARKILIQTKEEATDIISEVRRLEKERDVSALNKEAEEIRLRLKSKIETIEDSLAEAIMPKQGYAKPPKNLKPGESVQILSINQKGSVLTVPNSDGEVMVQAGIMKINVLISNLKRINEQSKDTHIATRTGKTVAEKSKAVSNEIDLRGTTLEEAIDRVEKFLDESSISGLHEVTIIHGKGTGVLRSGIQRILKSNSHVRSFRLGKYGEGESGVTVVELG